MPASTSTFRRCPPNRLAILILLIATALSPHVLLADDNENGGSSNNSGNNSGNTSGGNSSGNSGTSGDKNGGVTTKPEDEDYSQTPYTEYGSFNEEKEEEEDTRFFQYGRFFGLSLGVGIETADGDRGTLYQGGWPTFDAKIHYWFDFNFALDIDFYYATHYFIANDPPNFSGRYDVNIIRLGVDFKYYFDTKNLGAAITFANPYVLVGAGSYTQTTSADAGQTSAVNSNTAVGFNAGAGLEFALKPRRVYFTTEARIHVVQFADNNSTAFAAEGLPDLHGNFYTFIGSILFTW